MLWFFYSFYLLSSGLRLPTTCEDEMTIMKYVRHKFGVPPPKALAVGEKKDGNLSGHHVGDLN